MPAMAGTGQATQRGTAGTTFIRSDQIVIGGAVGGIALSAVITYGHLGEVTAFCVTSVTVIVTASLLGSVTPKMLMGMS